MILSLLRPIFVTEVIHYENTLIQICRKFHLQKTENFQIKKTLIFFIFLLKTYIVGTRYNNKYPKSMFLSRNKKTNLHPCKSQFYYIKMGFKGVKILSARFRDVGHSDSLSKYDF